MERKSLVCLPVRVERHACGVGHTCVSLVLNPRVRIHVGRPRPTRGSDPLTFGGPMPRVHAGHKKGGRLTGRKLSTSPSCNNGAE